MRPIVKAYIGERGEYDDDITGRYGNLEWPPYFTKPCDDFPKPENFGFIGLYIFLRLRYIATEIATNAQNYRRISTSV